MNWTREQYEAFCQKVKIKPADEKKFTPKTYDDLEFGKWINEFAKQPAMSKTEIEYERIYLRDKPHKFEGITFHMSNGHRYTPDFFVWSNFDFMTENSDMIECHEVKGSYKLQSYGRAKLAFDQCQQEFPMFKFVWATKTKEGWVIT